MGGSLRDVHRLARHPSLQTTQRYIEGDFKARRRDVISGSERSFKRISASLLARLLGPARLGDLRCQFGRDGLPVKLLQHLDRGPHLLRQKEPAAPYGHPGHESRTILDPTFRSIRWWTKNGTSIGPSCGLPRRWRRRGCPFEACRSPRNSTTSYCSPHIRSPCKIAQLRDLRRSAGLAIAFERCRLS